MFVLYEIYLLCLSHKDLLMISKPTKLWIKFIHPHGMKQFKYPILPKLNISLILAIQVCSKWRRFKTIDRVCIGFCMCGLHSFHETHPIFMLQRYAFTKEDYHLHVDDKQMRVSLKIRHQRLRIRKNEGICVCWSDRKHSKTTPIEACQSWNM